LGERIAIWGLLIPVSILGLLRFWKDKIGARRAGIIEYK